MNPYKKVWKLFNDPRINVPIRKKSANLFHNPCINKSYHTKKCLETNLLIPISIKMPI